MNKKEIEELIKFVSKAGVSEVSLEIKDFKLTIKNNSSVVREVIVNTPAAPAVMPTVHAPVAVATPVAAAPPAKPSAPSADDDSKYIQIKSPMVGTFYRAASPEKPNFINPGEEIGRAHV